MTSSPVEAASRGVIDRYFDHLPVSAATPVVTLGEGSTPLLRSEATSDEIGAEVWLKCEGTNPTGSFKDRGMAVAVSKALEEGSGAVVCASTGNTSASAAAYAARAGLRCAVLVPETNVARGKLAQTLLHGARVLQIDGNFDRALQLTKELASLHPVTVVNSINPYRLEGQKTAAFEIVAALGRAPDLHLMPVGNAGNITAQWRGYREAEAAGWASRTPAMCGFQARGADPIVRGEVVADPATVATAISIGNPASWRGAEEAALASGGRISSVDDEDIIAAYRSLAREGIFVELASAVPVAGLRMLHRERLVPPGAIVACVLTGHGLKDPEAALAAADGPTRVRAEVSEIAEALALA